jgi:hypothetical protein
MSRFRKRAGRRFELEIVNAEEAYGKSYGDEEYAISSRRYYGAVGMGLLNTLLERGGERCIHTDES